VVHQLAYPADVVDVAGELGVQFECTSVLVCLGETKLGDDRAIRKEAVQNRTDHA
jgi:hypothetical protein